MTKGGLTGAELERSIRYSLERTRNRRELEKLNEMLEVRVFERTCELEQANRELREADARKDEFLATLAHELRNPLAPISSALALLNMSDGNSQDAILARRTMERQLAQMVRLIDDLLEISRISRGKIELRRVHADLRDIVQQAVEASKPLYDSKQQTLSVQLPETESVLHVDPARIAQVIGNLLNNASKFTNECGHVELQVAFRDQEVDIVVSDNGIGLASDHLPRIFELFAQVDQSLERSQGGLGIGLTLVKSLVEYHGGRVQAESEGIGKGSRFTITLPRLAESDSQFVTPVRTKISPPSLVSGRRILVVDDNRDSANLLAMLLRASKNEVYLAFDGIEAVTVAEATLPDVVLLDIGMPRQNGYETARQIRQRNARPTMIVAMTGWGQEEDRRRSKDAGFDYHLVKPIDLNRLEELLRIAPESERCIVHDR